MTAKSVYGARLSGGAILGTSIEYTLATRPAAGVVGRLIYLTDQFKVQLDTGTQWVNVGDISAGGSGLISVNSLQTLGAGGTVPTVLGATRQLTPVVSSGGLLTLSTSTPIGNGANNGEEHYLLGTDDDNPLRITEGTNLLIAGPIDLVNGAQIGFVWYNSKWREISRNA